MKERRKRMERKYMDDYKGISETVKAATVFQQLLFLVSAGFLPVFSSTSFSSSTLLAFLLRPWEFSFVAPLFCVFFWLVACSVCFFILVLLEILPIFLESLTENRNGKCEYVIGRNNGISIILVELRLVRKDFFLDEMEKYTRETIKGIGIVGQELRCKSQSARKTNQFLLFCTWDYTHSKMPRWIIRDLSERVF